MKHFRNESGQILVLAALSMMLLLAFVALATDVGLLFRAKRNAQIAADAAAVAGALDYKYNGSAATAKAAGQTAATANGITNGVNGAVVTVSEPPTDGPNQSNGFVEAVVTQPNPTFFLGMFGHSLVSVRARAVAGSGVNNGCIWTLGRKGEDIAMTGNGLINVPDCAIYDDSNANNALDLTGNGGINARAIGIVGNNPGYVTTGNESIQICNPTCTAGDPTTGIAPAASPLTLTPPTMSSGSGCQKEQTLVGNGTLNLQPGCYNGISVTGNGTVNFAPGNYVINGSISPTGNWAFNFGAGNYTINGSFTDTGNSAISFGAGVYAFSGNLSLTGNATLTGTGVTFYTQGQTTVTGNGSSDLEAPTSGPYNGVLFYQDASDTKSMTITGNAGSVIKGIFYAPAAGLTFTGNSSTGIYADFITDSLTFTGNTAFKSYQSINASALLGKTVMVE